MMLYLVSRISTLIYLIGLFFLPGKMGGSLHSEPLKAQSLAFSLGL